MPVEQLQRVFQSAYKVVRAHAADDAADGILLAQFMNSKDESAFAELVRRHGAMVLGVCRRVIGSHHEAEDAFQATFLVLVRKAGSLTDCKHLAGWLHSVAYRTALEARGRLARQRTREAPLSEFPERTDDASMRNEIKTIIDREVSQLPDKYRMPVILCELEGKSRFEAARMLRLSEGTLSSRLASARKALARRLSKYGFSLPATGLAVFADQQAMGGVVPEHLADTAVNSAVHTLAGKAMAAIPASVLSLADTVMRTMSFTRAKFIGACVLLVGMITTGAIVGSTPDNTRSKDAVAALPNPIEQPVGLEPQADELVAAIDRPREQALDLKERIKLMETDIARIRREVLEACRFEERKIDEALRKANADMFEAVRRKDFEGQRLAFQAIGKANNDKVVVNRMRAEAEMRIRIDDPHYEQRVGLQMSTGPANVFGKMINGSKDRGGMMIERVTRDSPAAVAGLQPMDVLVEIGGKPVPNGLADFRKMLAEFEPEVPVDVSVYRKGRKQTIKGLVMPGIKG